MVFTLSCTAIPAGMGHFEIPCPRHVEPSPHERLVGTSLLPDLLLCVLIKTGWSSTGPFPWAEGNPHPNTNRGHKYWRWQSGDLMCSLEYCPTKFFKQFRTGSGQNLSARGSRKRQLKKQTNKQTKKNRKPANPTQNCPRLLWAGDTHAQPSEMHMGAFC